MAVHTTLSSLFTAIADAIRAKTGGTDAIVADAFPESIMGISTGIAPASFVETALPSSTTWRSVTYGNGKFVAVASDSDKAVYSTDGINWTETTLPSSTTWRSVTESLLRYLQTLRQRIPQMVLTGRQPLCRVVLTGTLSPMVTESLLQSVEVRMVRPQ